MTTEHPGSSNSPTGTHLLTNISSGLRRAWHPVMRASELLIEQPTRIELLGEPYVVTRFANKVTAFVDRCPHRNARLSDGCVTNGHLQCPYHGWEFDSAGQAQFIPALGAGATLPPNSTLTPAHVKEHYDLIWIAPEDPVAELLHIAEWDDPTLRKVWLPTVLVTASAGQLIDNFLDFGHFPFVHAGTFGAGEDANVHDYSVERSESGWGFVVDYAHSVTNKEDPKVETGEHPLMQPRIMRYEFQAPFSCNLHLEFPLTAMMNAIVMMCQPVNYNTTQLFMVMLRNDCPTDQLASEAIDYEMAIFAEDLKVVEFLYNKEIPLERGQFERGQLHTRADRNTVEFRRIMQRLVTVKN